MSNTRTMEFMRSIMSLLWIFIEKTSRHRGNMCRYKPETATKMSNGRELAAVANPLKTAMPGLDRDSSQRRYCVPVLVIFHESKGMYQRIRDWFWWILDRGWVQPGRWRPSRSSELYEPEKTIFE